MAPHGYQCRVVTQEQLTASFFIPQEMFPNIAKNTSITLWCQIEDTVLLIGTLLLFDPVLFTKYEERLLIESIPNFEALLGAPLIKTT